MWGFLIFVWRSKRPVTGVGPQEHMGLVLWCWQLKWFKSLCDHSWMSSLTCTQVAEVTWEPGACICPVRLLDEPATRRTGVPATRRTGCGVSEETRAPHVHACAWGTWGERGPGPNYWRDQVSKSSHWRLLKPMLCLFHSNLHLCRVGLVLFLWSQCFILPHLSSQPPQRHVSVLCICSEGVGSDCRCWIQWASKYILVLACFLQPFVLTLSRYKKVENQTLYAWNIPRPFSILSCCGYLTRKSLSWLCL